MTDPAISELRKIRVQLAEESGNDLDRLLELVSRETRMLIESGVFRPEAASISQPLILNDAPLPESND